MRRDVVVLPFVPVMTIDPNFKSCDNLRRMSRSIARATSPGSVVPPPRRLNLERAPVALPAQTAAVLRIMPKAPRSA